MARNGGLVRAKAARRDEYYTRLDTVMRELGNYGPDEFAGRVVYCPCDDYRHSSFFRYFVLNFDRLGLRRLVCTSYAPTPLGDGVSYKAEVTTVPSGMDFDDSIAPLFGVDGNVCSTLHGDGDVFGPECRDLLDEADVVVTNPPFSRIRELIDLLVSNDKDFLLLAGQHVISYKETFRLVMEGRLRFGATSGSMTFDCPTADGSGMTERKLGNLCWLTTLRHFGVAGSRPRRTMAEQLAGNEALVRRLGLEDTPVGMREYPRYGNYDAIEVPLLGGIPCDYEGVMGVPPAWLLTMLGDDEYEVLGSTHVADSLPVKVQLGDEFVEGYRRQGGTGHYSSGMYAVWLIDGHGRYVVPYNRVLIRKRPPAGSPR